MNYVLLLKDFFLNKLKEETIYTLPLILILIFLDDMKCIGKNRI